MEHKPAKYIITTGGFDTDCNNLKEALKTFKMMKKNSPVHNTEYICWLKLIKKLIQQ